MHLNNPEQFEVRDLREKEKFVMDDKFLNGYARFLGVYAVGVYLSLCRHANKQQKTWPSNRKMAQKLSISKNKIIESIKYLEFWKIIKKVRVGLHCTNRYFLLNKPCWKVINEQTIKEFAEVYNKDFKSLQDKLQELTTKTSNSKETHSKETQEKGVSSFKKNKPSFRGEEMRRDYRGKWWVVPKEGGPWKEFALGEKDIEWR